MSSMLLAVLIWLSLGALIYSQIINKETLDDILKELKNDPETHSLPEVIIREVIFSRIFLVYILIFSPLLFPAAMLYTLYKYLKGDYNETSR